MEAILSRHSIRRYLSKEISKEILLSLVHAGMSAPSAMHSNPWHFIVVTERARLDGVTNLHPYAGMSSHAAAGILVCGEPERETFKDFFAQNCAAAVENILIGATDFGLGSVWVGIYPNAANEENFRKYFNLPDGIVPFAWIPLGYSEGRLSPDNRLDSSRIHYNFWQE